MSNNPAELQNERDNLQAEDSNESVEQQVTGEVVSDSGTSPVEEVPTSPDSPSAEVSEAVSDADQSSPSPESVESDGGGITGSEEPGAASTSAEDDSTGDVGAAEESTGTAEAEKPKIKIGSQRSETTDEVLVPKAVKDAQETTVPIAGEVAEKAEPVDIGPSVTDLGQQWEKEAEEVLEGKSVSQLMESAAEGADAELAVNSRIKGTVTKSHGDHVFFLLKGQYDGVLPAKQFKKEPEPGTMTDVVVTGFNSDDNLYELALPGAAVAVADWSDLEVGKRIEVRITGSNTGGLECSVNNIRGFIPASQIDVSRVDNLGAFINQTMECVITEANKKKKNLVLSRRSILEKELNERKKEILEEFEVGSVIEGKITKLRDFGAFVNIGSGVEGLIHISKCSWHHIKHPKEVFEDGQDVSVRIEKINKETGKIQLSHRDTVEHPWKRVSEKYPAESTVKGTVSKIADFGAFIKLETGVEGLVHISEIAHERVKSVASVLTEGQEIECKVLSLDPDKQKMSLSIKSLLPEPVREEKKPEQKESKEPPREMAVKKRNKPLKGGTGGGAGGDQFGLKW